MGLERKTQLVRYDEADVIITTFDTGDPAKMIRYHNSDYSHLIVETRVKKHIGETMIYMQRDEPIYRQKHSKAEAIGAHMDCIDSIVSISY